MRSNKQPLLLSQTCELLLLFLWGHPNSLIYSPTLSTLARIDPFASSIRHPRLRSIMCLRCFLHCPVCYAYINGVSTLYRCLLKLPNLQDRSSCTIRTIHRHMTPIEMVLTARSCPTLDCSMNVTQQLIAQSRIWHAVDVMDEQQRVEHQAPATSVPRWERAKIEYLSGDSSKIEPIPPIAGGSNSSIGQWPSIPTADTPENFLLHRFRCEFRQAMESKRHQSNKIEDKTAFWGKQMNAALDLVGRAIYRPGKLYKSAEPINNGTRAATDEDYAMLCSDQPPYLLWPDARRADQSDLPQASGSQNMPDPTSGSKRKASSQSPVASRSTPTGSQLEPGHASSRPLQPRPTPVDFSLAAGSSVALPPSNTSNVASNNTYGLADPPDYHARYPSQSNSASVDIGDNSEGVDQESVTKMLQNTSGFDNTPGFSQFGHQQPFPGSMPPGQYQGSSFASHQAATEPSSSTAFMVTNQYGSDQSTPSNPFQVQAQTGQMNIAQPPSQANASIPYPSTGGPPASMSASHAQSAAGIAGPTFHPGIPTQPQYGQPYPGAGGSRADMFSPYVHPVARGGGPAPQPGNATKFQSGQTHSSTNDRLANASRIQTQPIANMDGPPPQPAISAPYDHTFAAPEAPEAPPSKSPDNAENPSSNN